MRLGNPHGEVFLGVGGEAWTVEVGQPCRNERAGLTDDLLSVGRTITVHGHRSARERERLVEAERVVIDGRTFDLCPDRVSRRGGDGRRMAVGAGVQRPCQCPEGVDLGLPPRNAGHLLGVSLLVGGIVPLDLRLLGIWGSVPAGPLWRVLTRTAGVGLGLAAGFGVLLFAARATEVSQSRLFLAKMAAVAAGAVAAHRIVSSGRWPWPGDGTPSPGILRLAGGISLGAWLTSLVLGRLVGYF